MDYKDQETAGQWTISSGISEENQTGGNVGVRLYCTSATGEMYADAAVFQLVGGRSETGWYKNTKSQAEYGTIELIVASFGMTDDAANALAQNTLNDKAWARIKAPIAIQPNLYSENETILELTFLGYVYTLHNFYATNGGTEDSASTIISSLIGESEFLTTGRIQSNSLSYYVEDYNDIRAWPLIEDITLAGDASGNRWVSGVYTSRKFYYAQAGTKVVARIRNGAVVAPGGGLLEGWLAEPGMIAIDDMPIAYDIGDREEDKLNRAWMSEVEWRLDDYLNGDPSIIYRQVII